MAGFRKRDRIPEPIRRRLVDAIPHAIDDTTAAAAIQAKQDHPGWRNRTGTAEGSIRMDPAQRVAPNRWRGMFGSFDVAYFIWLELGARGRPGDRTLQRAADTVFPSFPDRLRARLRS